MLRPPKGTSLGENTPFGGYTVQIGHEIGELRKKAKKERNKTQRFDKSHMPRPTTLRPEHKQQCQVSSKSGFWLTKGSNSAILLCLALWLI